MLSRLPIRPRRLPKAGRDAEEEQYYDGRADGKGRFVPAHEFLYPVRHGGRARHNRFVAEVTLQILRQVVGSVVTPRAVLFQALHHNPIQIALEQMN